jgi:hypothetical protein
VAEIWESKQESGIQLLSGAHADSKMFGEYGNFHEVFKSLMEGTSEISKFAYTRTAGNPDTYTCVHTTNYPYSGTTLSTLEFNQDNTFSDLKLKLFSETLKSAAISVSSINGGDDTTEYKYQEQGTSGDNSKDLKIMFHNLPLLTNRNRTERINAIWTNQNNSKVRGTVNSGTLFYFDSATPHLPIKVNEICKFYYDADNLANFYWLDFPIPAPIVTTINYSLEILLKQQNSGLATTYCYAMVKTFGNKKQADAELTTTFVNVKNNLVGNRVKVNLANYNTILQEIYNSSTAKGVLLQHSLDIRTGMADLKIRIDAE